MSSHGLGLDAIAEGIEDLCELAFLRTLGCDRGQGYLFSEPRDRHGIEALLRTWDPAAISRLPQAAGVGGA